MLKTLWTRKLTIVVSVVVAVIAALAYSKTSTPTYQSSALLQINSPTQSGGSPSSFSFPDPTQTLANPTVQNAVAKALHDPLPQDLAGRVTGTSDPTTGTFTITGTGPSPESARAVTQAFAEAFVNKVQVIAQAQVDKYSIQITKYDAQIAALQSQQSPNSANALVNAQIAGITSTISTLQAAQSTIQIGMPFAVIQVAATPGASISISKSKLIAIGLLAGLMAGCGIALVREQFDDRVRVSPDIGSVIDGPLLGELPQDADVKKGEVTLALIQAPMSPLSESIRDLRTSLRVLLVDQQSPILVVTSPEPGDGKTFVTANLAVSWALTGARVIVVSADFRRPRLEDAFGVDAVGKPGLSDLIKANWKQAEPEDEEVERGIDELTSAPGSRSRQDRDQASRSQGRHSSAFGDSAVSTHLLETGIDGLQLLPVGVHLDNPSELFDSPGIQPVLDQLHLLADIILLDTPPVLSAPDTAILGSLTHGAVVVASEGKTDRADLERTANRLEATGCQVLGLVLNHVRRTTSDGYQAYSYQR
jgi:Mrp family chromosome partitioning ATPase/capsular polysaccharide biosynthesis protein